MRTSTLFAGLASLAASTYAFTVTNPSSSGYWVQFSTNTISWTTGGSDPSVVSLQIVNPNVKQLNGVFSIAEYVKASLQSYTVTNVTLLVGDGYQVQMVNSTNATQVYASSGAFSVKDANTTAAPLPSSSGSNGGSTTGTTTGANGTSTSGTNNGRNFTGSSNSTAGNAKNSAVHVTGPAAGLMMASAALIGSFVL